MAQNWSQNEARGTKRRSLFERGLQLYEESVQTGFQNVELLERGLCFIVQAAEAGEHEAIQWIGIFHMTESSHPTRLPSELREKIRRIAQQSEREERQSVVMPSQRFSTHAGYQSMPLHRPVLEQQDEDVIDNPGPTTLPANYSSESEERVATTAKSMFSRMAGSTPTRTIPRDEIHERVQDLFSGSEEFESGQE